MPKLSFSVCQPVAYALCDKTVDNCKCIHKFYPVQIGKMKISGLNHDFARCISVGVITQVAPFTNGCNFTYRSIF